MRVDVHDSECYAGACYDPVSWEHVDLLDKEVGLLNLLSTISGMIDGC